MSNWRKRSIETRCCNHPNIIIDGFKIVCTNRGSVHGYKSGSYFVDFYGNTIRIRKKSVNHRKYHVLNVMNDISQKNRMQIGYYNREQILSIFALRHNELTQTGNRWFVLNSF